MFIGWLKHSDVARAVAIADEMGWPVDGYHVKLLITHAPHLCYGAYEEGELIGLVAAVEFEKSAMIKYFLVKNTHQGQGIGRRLFATLMSALEGVHATVTVHTCPELEGFFAARGFVTTLSIGRFVNVGKVPPFHFTNAHAKELESLDFEIVMGRIDAATFGERRADFLLDEMDRNSSLKFVLPHAFQHSSVINSRYVHLGPWQVEAGYEEEAEKMMRGVIYYRGLKKVIADIPLGRGKAEELYRVYHFEQKQTLLHMVRGIDPGIAFENIYAFSL